MTHVRTANKCFLCVQTMSGLSPGVKCQVTVFFSNRFLCHKTRCDLLLYKSSHPYHSGLGKVEPWHRTLRSSSQNISPRVSSRCRASSKSFVTSTKFDRIAGVTVAPARRLRACRPDATGHINQPHERVRNGVVDVRGYVTPQSTGQLRRLRVGGDYDGQPIRLYVVDIVTDNSELVGEILHHPDWDS